MATITVDKDNNHSLTLYAPTTSADSAQHTLFTDMSRHNEATLKFLADNANLFMFSSCI